MYCGLLGRCLFRCTGCVMVFDEVFTFSQAGGVTLTLIPEADGAGVCGVFFDSLRENTAP